MSTKSLNIIIYRTIGYLNLVTNSKYELSKYAFNEDMCKLINKGYGYEDFKKAEEGGFVTYSSPEFLHIIDLIKQHEALTGEHISK